VCHGDLHPFNLLADPDGTITVLDWTAAAIAPPAFDVALTWLLLRHPPLDAPRALRPVIGAGAAILARRFLHAYRDANPDADLAPLDWYAALHSTRVLIDLSMWQRDSDLRAAAHPWRLVAPGAAPAVRRATGIEVATRSTAR
jgi:aminoglycoside phosphotransferase (APT) family kinase protein